MPTALPIPRLAERRHHRRVRAAFRWLPMVLALYFAGAYLVAPALWRRFERYHRLVAEAPKITTTKEGIPGDPVNIALVGTRDQVLDAMAEAGWSGADPITPRTTYRMAVACSLGEGYSRAPVSDLYLFGRVQDLAFQQPKGKSPRQRHHVRFWLAPEPAGDLGAPSQVPLWLGAVTFDRAVGVSYRTGQITHHIGSDIDAERDKLLGDLRAAGWVASTETAPGLTRGRNGGGDPYWSDGHVVIIYLARK